jgi:hypothetical protein
VVVFEAATVCEGSKFRYATFKLDEMQALAVEKIPKLNSCPKSS